MTQQHTGATPIQDTAPTIDGANLHNPKDFAKVLDYFRYNIGTSLDCMFATGILRNSITWYISHAEDMGLIKAVKKDYDKRTHMMAKHYSADPEQWRNIPKEPTLFDDFFKDGGVYAKS